MHVLVIGITGRVGKRIARALLARGHRVRGVNRRADRVAVRVGDLAVDTQVADAGDRRAMLMAMFGIDVVILAAAPTREHPEHYPEQSRIVLEAAKRAGVARLIAISNYKALRAPDGRPMLEAEPPHPYFHAIEAVHAAEAAIFKDETALDWLLVAPPAELYPYGEATGAYRVGDDRLVTTDPSSMAFKDVSQLSMEDFADFVAREVDEHRYSRALINVAY